MKILEKYLKNQNKKDVRNFVNLNFIDPHIVLRVSIVRN